ncbi:hypothetical protein RG47T_1860 [Mucilaginibacter polytrichastri]|uniref:Uncharacterized protein n=1 Tax=Mucilaginibacter polytrichastri TaxID=1302689 RepID=A0A1Q5ZXA2_9SPHI|nr:hypothetical protein RG47T_1860 [Mucilaginibacter polytrichastri]SFT20660.1 hypothetical protein SAMN04487890_1174 [Mucilaginibacter polytrichastri]
MFVYKPFIYNFNNPPHVYNNNTCESYMSFVIVLKQILIKGAVIYNYICF